jgi:hypothetical protein
MDEELVEIETKVGILVEIILEHDEFKPALSKTVNVTLNVPENT